LLAVEAHWSDHPLEQSSRKEGATITPHFRQPVARVQYSNTPAVRRGSGMEYRQFVISAFERVPSKWRARVSRIDGKLFRANGHFWTKNSETDSDAATAADALLMALATLDRGLISPAEKTPIEKFWRRSAPVRRKQSGVQPLSVARNPTSLRGEK
jgi:hypothetical protein